LTHFKSTVYTFWSTYNSPTVPGLRTPPLCQVANLLNEQYTWLAERLGRIQNEPLVTSLCLVELCNKDMYSQISVINCGGRRRRWHTSTKTWIANLNMQPNSKQVLGCSWGFRSSVMWRFVTGLKVLLALFTLEDDCTITLQDFGNYSTKNRASHPRRHESLEPMSEVWFVRLHQAI